MSNIAIDTNILSQFTGQKRLSSIDLAKLSTDIFVPITVYAETKAGVLGGRNPNKYLKMLEDFMASKSVHLNEAITSATADIYAEIYAYLKKRGTPVSPNDLWIAAECVEQNFVLLTLDSDFDKMPQVRRFHP